MTAPAPPTPPVGEVSPSPSPSPTASPTFKPPPTPRPPPVPFTGFRSSLEHTGIPRSVLTWRPRLPSRNWTIFLTVISTISYLYYDDRRQCRIVKQRTIDRVKHLAQEPVKGSLDLPRKVLVVGARWADDDDEDRALRYFRKYVKVNLSYLVHVLLLPSSLSTMPSPVSSQLRLNGFEQTELNLLDVAILGSRSYRLRATPRTVTRLRHPPNPRLNSPKTTSIPRSRNFFTPNGSTASDGSQSCGTEGIGRWGCVGGKGEFEGVHGGFEEGLVDGCRGMGLGEGSGREVGWRWSV